MEEARAIAQYVPRTLLRRSEQRSWWQSDGTLLFSDVSGFTALSEKLARHGKVGAEEMVGAISTVFTPLLDEIAAYDGDVLKFGGDALLTFFDGPGHTQRAAACAHGLRRILREQGRVQTAYGTVPLGMSQGLHAGTFSFFLCGSSYADLVVCGPAVSATLAMESAAERGEVLLTAAAAGALPPRLLRPGHDDGLLLVKAPEASRMSAATGLSTQPGAERFVPLALRGRLADIVSDSEHRQITIAFLQFTGCDQVLENDGPDELHRRLHELTDTVTEAADEHGVTVICIDVGGDGGKFMLASGAPDAVEHDAELMLRFGLAVLSRDIGLPLRLGVNRGNVFGGRVGGPRRWTYSTMGDPVNLAARVMGKAPRGAVLATTAVTELVADMADLRPVEPFMVKGKAKPVQASVVLAMAHPSQHPVIEPASPFVGRDVELQRITARWPEVTAGRGCVFDIVGEAGSGKSRLVAEVARAVQPPRTVRVAGERYHRGSAYFALHLLIRRVTDISIDADPADAGRALSRWVAQHAPRLTEWLPLLAVAARAHVRSTETVDAIAAEFRVAKLTSLVQELLHTASTEPTLVFLDDAFWYDDASVQVLSSVLSEVSALPWLVCMTRRDESTGLHADDTFPATEIRLMQLSDESAIALARAAAPEALSADEAEHLAVAANRNPFFLLQIAQSWRPGESSVPPTVESVVSARLDRLPVGARRLLRRAAVLGGYVDVDVLSSVLGEPVTADALEPLVGEFLLPDSHDRYRFTHDLFRAVAYDSLPYRRRRELHARAGHALEHRGEHAARAALLSLHFEAAGEHEKTWKYGVLGADRARETYANGEAATLYERALSVVHRVPGVPAEELVRVHEALADVQLLLGHYDAAAQGYLEAHHLHPAPTADVRLLRKLGIVRERQSRYPEALRWYTRAIRDTESLSAADAAAARASLLVGTASTRYRQGRFRLAADAAHAAVDEAKAAEEPAELAHAYFLLDAALTDLHDARALEFRERALPIYQQIGDLVGEADVHNNIGIDAYYEGRLDDALTSYAQSLACRRRAGDLVGAATAENNIGEVLSDLGRYDEAISMFEEALAVWRRASYPVGIALACSNLARVHVRRGRPDLAGPYLDEAEQRFDDMGASVLLFETQVRRAEMLLATADADAALDLVASLRRSPAAATASDVVAADLDRLEADARAHISARAHIVLPEQRTIRLEEAPVTSRG
ncbi:MAG TPA: adenylate/guanylate cyclase domain-containing protein [Mycobacteriales bacterium]|nr:adenylate/guanylate cyclase domain-containing protein [Mycobacteriales bacterium]